MTLNHDPPKITIPLGENTVEKSRKMEHCHGKAGKKSNPSANLKESCKRVTHMDQKSNARQKKNFAGEGAT